VATAMYRCVMAMWERPAGKVLFTAGGWLIPKLDKTPSTDRVPTQVEDIEQGAPAHTVDLQPVPAQSRRREDVSTNVYDR